MSSQAIPKQSEAWLQQQVADYLRLQYPDVLFHSDYGSGIKLTPGQAAIQKRQNGGRRAWPDMFIAEQIFCLIDKWSRERTRVRIKGLCELYEENQRKPIDKNWDYISAGLFLELKKEGTRLKKKNGEWATEHINEQAEMLEELRKRGYCAEFAVGFGEAKKIIDDYLMGIVSLSDYCINSN